MPETEAPPAPAAPPSGVNIIEGAPPAPPPAPTREIHVTPGAPLDQGPTPTPPKRGSAMSRMREELSKRAKPTNAPDDHRPAEKQAAAGETPPSDAQSTATEGPPGKDKPVASEPGAPPAEKKKVNPWKMVDEYKGKVGTLEKEIVELRKSIPDPKAKEQTDAEVEAIRKRNAILEEEIRYTNYRKSREFEEKYQKPYEESWKKAMADLGELTLLDPGTQQERPLQPEDMLALVNMPLREARARAVELFGDFADDVMAHRKEIRNIFDAQQGALEEARKSGAARDEARRKTIEEIRGKVNKAINEVWSKANTEAIADERIAKFFKPVEGDEEGNKRLANGYALADKAFSGVDPRDPRLSPEQREEVIRVHAAVRHRAAAFGRVVHQLEHANAQIAKLKSELDKYRGAEPGKGQGVTQASQVGGGTAKDSVFGALRKLAH